MYIPFPYVYTASLYKKWYVVRRNSMKQFVYTICTKKWYICTVSSYKGTIFFVPRNGIYVPFLHTKNGTLITNTGIPPNFNLWLYSEADISHNEEFSFDGN